MVIYRRKTKHDAWHWCTNCPHWPTKDYFEIKRPFRPTNGDLCDECVELDKAHRCKKRETVDPEPPPPLDKHFVSNTCMV